MRAYMFQNSARLLRPHEELRGKPLPYGCSEAKNGVNFSILAPDSMARPGVGRGVVGSRGVGLGIVWRFSKSSGVYALIGSEI